MDLTHLKSILHSGRLTQPPEYMRMRIFLTTSISIICGTLLLQFAARGDDFDNMKADLAKSVFPCPPGLARAVMEPQHKRCGGDGTHSPCGEGTQFDRVCAQRYAACAKQHL